MSWMQKVSPRVLERFLDRVVSAPTVERPLLLLENPTEEIVEAHRRGRDIKLYGMSASTNAAREALKDMERKSGDIRYEENWLFFTRRYPKSTGNVIGAVAPSHIPAGDYLYFNGAQGGPGDAVGFPTGFELSGTETNMDTPNQTPQGKGFKIWAEGISFNTEARAEDIEQILDSGEFTYVTQGGQLTIHKGPFRMWPGGQGVSGFTTEQGVEAAHNGIADPRAMRTLKFPRVIKPLQNFNYHHVVARSNRATTDQAWELSQFTLCSVGLWGHQLDAIPG